MPERTPPNGGKPKWLKHRTPGGARYLDVRKKLKTLDLHTVCEEAHCPNVGECWGGGTATIMILGDTCTRGCRFCAVKTGNPKGVLDGEEPERVGRAVSELGLQYVVLTSVDRDDLPDGGAAHFAETLACIRAHSPEIRTEVLIPDFGGDWTALETLVAARPDVVAHNVEVVQRLTPDVRDKRADYQRSIDLLRQVKRIDPARLTKSSIMVGLGERDEELQQTMHDLREADVDIVTLGQYLQPSSRHLAVDRYYTPEEFAEMEQFGRAIGFRYVASGPMVRSSYRAGELFVKGILARRDS